MDGRSETQKRLATLLDELAVHEGMQATSVEGVQVLRRTVPLPRTLMVYHPNILIVGQGRKRAYLADELYAYDTFNYLVLSVPLPVECETDAVIGGTAAPRRHRRPADDARRDDARNG
jgi:hypothetical protein